MKFSDNAMCAILLSSHVGIRKEDEKPFTLGEWNTFLEKVIAAGLEPKVIFDRETDWGSKLSYDQSQVDRIQRLLARGGNLAFELDEWNRKGIGVVTLFDTDYPVLLKRRLKKKTPPVFFYAGDLLLAKKVGIAVAGSRNVDEKGIAFARGLAQKAAQEKMIVYSGGARGIDNISEQTTIQYGGAAVSYVADSMLSRIKKSDVTEALMNGQLLLLSDVKPDAGFSVARAMNRNKYIYASAYGAFVVASDYNKGGTWAGAVEAINRGWGKTLVWENGDYPGNKKLIEKGATPYELSEERLYDVVTRMDSYEQLDLFSAKQDQ